MKKLFFVVFSLFFFTLPLHAQNEIYSLVETSPEFPGGEKALYQYLINHIRYPVEATNKKMEGRVYLSFIIETNGSISGVKLLKGIGAGCDQEAVRVVESMPQWQPGIQNGKYVRVRYNIPVLFRLSNMNNNAPSLNPNALERNLDAPNKVYMLVDDYPVLNVLERDIMIFISSHLKYPETENNCKTMLSFIIEKAGTISDVRIDQSCGPVLDAEAIRVIQLTNGKWIPAKKEGEKVRIQYFISVSFQRN